MVGLDQLADGAQLDTRVIPPNPDSAAGHHHIRPAHPARTPRAGTFTEGART